MKMPFSEVAVMLMKCTLVIDPTLVVGVRGHAVM